MITELNYDKLASTEPVKLSTRKCRRLTAPVSGIYNEEYFEELLCNERKRTERSGKPFLLLILNIEKILQVVESGEVLKDMLSVMVDSIRETDLVGWYRNEAEVGIIFTEIDEHGARQAIEAIASKIRSNLLRNLPLGLISGIEPGFHFYPEKYNAQTPVNFIDSSLYPDIKDGGSSRRMPRFLKRSIDLFGSVIALILFSPFFLIIPLLIKLTSKGPVLFRQERIGQLGKKFVFLKFRSMRVDCDDSIHREYITKLIAGDANTEPGKNAGGSPGVYKLLDDPRITPIGRFLRKSSLDEIPQFFNVLKGEMSLVGPRPPIPYEFEKYDIWHRHRLLQVKPGITGLWQVKGRSSTSFDDMVRLDLKYVREWTPWLDLTLLLRTPWAVLKGKGAY